MADYTASIRLEGEDNVSPLFEKVKGQLEQTTRLMSSFGETSAAASAAVVGTIAAVVEGYTKLAEAIIALRSEDEKREIQLATAVGTNKSWVDSLATGKEVLEKLKDIAAKTNQSVDAVTAAFRLNKMAIGASSEETLRFTQTLATFASAGGESVDTYMKLIDRVLISGKEIQTRSAEGMRLLAAGVTADMIKAAQQGGQELEKLTEKLKLSDDASKGLANTWASLKSQLKLEEERFLEGLEDQFIWIKKLVEEATAALKKFNEAKAETFLGGVEGVLVGADVQDAVEAAKGVADLQTDIEKNSIAIQRNIAKTIEALGPLIEKTQKAQESWRAYIADLQGQVKLAGLEGIDKQLAALDESERKALAQAEKNAEAYGNLEEAKTLIRDRFARERMKILVNEARADDLAAQEWQSTVTKAAADVEKAIAGLRKKGVTDAISAIKSQVDFEHAAIDDQLERYRKLLEDKRISQEAFDRFFKESAEAKQRIEEIGALRTEQLLARNEDNWDRYFYAVQQGAQRAGDFTYSTFAANLSATAALAVANAQTISQGIAAGLRTIQAAAKTQGQAIAGYMIEVWNTIGTGFTDLVYNTITGKFDSLVDVLKGIWDSILRSFSKLVSDMVMKWLSGMVTIQNASNSGGWGMGAGNGMGFGAGVGNGPQYGAGFNWAGALGAGATGLAFGTAIGGGSNVPGIAGALAGIGVAAFGTASTPIIGSLIASLGPTVVGAIVAVVVAGIGALIVALLRKSTEQIERITGQEIFSQSTARGTQAWQKYGATLGSLSGIMQMGGGSRGDLMRYMRGGEIPDEFIRSTYATFRAGNPDDLASLWQDWLTKHFPRTLISMAFGQTPTGGYVGGQIGGVEGIPAFVKGSFDPGAPIPTMLAGLGFTAKAISAIAEQIDTRDPDKFLEWLGRLTTVVKGFMDLGAEFGKSSTQIFADIQAGYAKTPTQMFAEGAANIVELASELSLYVGDDQLAKAEEILKLGQQYYDQQIAYLKSLYDLQKSITESVEQQIRGMRLEMMTPEQRSAFLMGETQTLIGRLAAATTPQEISDIMRQIQANVSSLFTSATDKGSILGLLESLLTQARDAATARITALAAEAVAQNPKLADAMNQAAALFQDMSPALDAVTEAAANDAAALGANAAAANASAAALSDLATVAAGAADAVAAFKAAFAGGVSQTISTVRAQPNLFAPATGV